MAAKVTTKVTARPLQAATLRDIRRYAHQALQDADALEATPTPLADVELAAGLLPAQAMLDLDDDLPPAFAAIAAKLASKVEGGLDTAHKQVYLREDLWAQRRRFVHGHEIGHRALPWHEQAYYADDATTLDPQTRDELEREANAFSAELLFGIDRFALLADDLAPSIQVPLDLASLFDTSAHSALRRYVDTSAHRVALLALGRMPNSTSQGSRLPVITAQCGQSGSFAERYGPITQITPSGVLLRDPAFAAAHQCSKGEVIQDAGEVVLTTRRGRTRFSTDAFTNGRLTFVLLRARASGRHVAA